jgi:hypothetical protein
VQHVRLLEDAFDLRAYLKQVDPRAKIVGSDIEIQCPECGRRKMYVTVKTKIDANGMKYPGTWCCFYCGDGGQGAISLVMRLEECSRGEAFRFLLKGEYVQEAVKKVDLKATVTEAFTDVTVPTGVEPLPEIRLPESFRFCEDLWDTRQIPPYIREAPPRGRGLTLEDCRRYGIGFTSPTDADRRMRHRLVVPVMMHDNGPLVSYQARWLAPKPPEGIKKSLYPAKTIEGTVVGRLLFGYDEARSCKRVILVEDVFSRIVLGRLFPGALGTFGTNLTRAQLDLLLATAAEEIVFMWDRDTMVRHKPTRCMGPCPHCRRYEKAQALIHKLSAFWSVRPVILPDDRDPDEHDPAFLKALIDASPLLDHDAAFKHMVLSRLT